MTVIIAYTSVLNVTVIVSWCCVLYAAVIIAYTFVLNAAMLNQCIRASTFWLSAAVVFPRASGLKLHLQTFMCSFPCTMSQKYIFHGASGAVDVFCGCD